MQSMHSCRDIGRDIASKYIHTQPPPTAHAHLDRDMATQRASGSRAVGACAVNHTSQTSTAIRCDPAREVAGKSLAKFHLPSSQAPPDLRPILCEREGAHWCRRGPQTRSLPVDPGVLTNMYALLIRKFASSYALLHTYMHAPISAFVFTRLCVHFHTRASTRTHARSHRATCIHIHPHPPRSAESSTGAAPA